MKKENTKDLRSLYHQLVYLSIICKKSLKTQAIDYESQVKTKIVEYHLVKESEFQATSEFLTLSNLINIEQTLETLHSRIMSLIPKLVESQETLPGLLNSLATGMDRLFLEDNIICDEKLLFAAIQKASKAMSIFMDENSEKFKLITNIWKNLVKLQSIVDEEDKALAELGFNFSEFRMKSYSEKEDELRDRLIEMNERLESDLFA